MRYFTADNSYFAMSLASLSGMVFTFFLNIDKSPPPQNSKTVQKLSLSISTEVYVDGGEIKKTKIKIIAYKK